MSLIEWPEFVRKRYALSKAGLATPETRWVSPQEINNQPDIPAKDVTDWYYAVLSILDSKASALMRLNGVVVAASAFVIGLFGRPNCEQTQEAITDAFRSQVPGCTPIRGEPLDVLLMGSTILVSLFSMLLCLCVVRISWPFLGKVTISADQQFDFSQEILELDRVFLRRVCAYQTAWYLSAFSAFVLIIEFLLQVVVILGFAR